MSPTTLTIFFALSNLLVSPAYILMMFLPKREITTRYMRSLWWIAPLVVLYVTLAGAILAARPNLMLYWNDLYVQGGIFGSAALLLSEIYGTYPETAVLHGWIHIVIGDLFMARWLYFDTQERPIPTWLASFLVLMVSLVGPIGMAAYLIARALTPRPTAQ